MERRGKEMCVDSVPREAALRKGHDHVLHRKWPGPVLVRQQNQEERGVIIAKCEVYAGLWGTLETEDRRVQPS